MAVRSALRGHSPEGTAELQRETEHPEKDRDHRKREQIADSPGQLRNDPLRAAGRDVAQVGLIVTSTPKNEQPDVGKGRLRPSAQPNRLLRFLGANELDDLFDEGSP